MHYVGQHSAKCSTTIHEVEGTASGVVAIPTEHSTEAGNAFHHTLCGVQYTRALRERTAVVNNQPAAEQEHITKGMMLSPDSSHRYSHTLRRAGGHRSHHAQADQDDGRYLVAQQAGEEG